MRPTVGSEGDFDAPTSPGLVESDLAIIDPSRYDLGAEVGRGGMGRIVLAQDRRLPRQVAIKQLLPDRPGTSWRRFIREVKITARLQHPGIVPIYEGGRWPTGEPFYVMKHVAGVSLEDAIAGATSPVERMGLLRNVIVVADALAYSHRQRIVHRDLKPSNVLVGEFGETVIIDWGLAKDLAATGEEDDEAAVSRDGAAGLTSAAGVLGTPSYMPPEQARGAAVDERGDVYALGAMLYHVLCGQPPYAGESSKEVLERVIASPPLPLAEQAPALPADLLAIVAKAMARKPEDRYRSAAELAGDLKRFEAGQLVGAHSYSLPALLWRWARRHRGAVTVALVALAIVATVTGLAVRGVVTARDRAEDQRGVAERQRAVAVGERQAADSLVVFMLSDLRDRLGAIGKMSFLESTAQRIDDYYQRLAAQTGSLDSAARSRRADAVMLLGAIQADKGDLDGAERRYREALTEREALRRAEPDKPAWRQGVALAQIRLGAVASQRGDIEKARAFYGDALALLEPLAAAAPDDSRLMGSLYSVTVRAGDSERLVGTRGAALDLYRKALAIAVRMVPADPLWETDLLDSHLMVGDMELERANTDAAAEHYQAAVTLAEKQVAAAPDDAQRQHALMLAVAKRGDGETARRDHAAAARSYAQALTLCEGLVARDPEDMELQHLLAIMHLKRSDVGLVERDFAGVRREAGLTKAIAERAMQRDPVSPRWRQAVAAALDNLARAATLEGDRAAALDAYRASLALQERLAADAAGSSGAQMDLAVGHLQLGQALTAMRRLDEAMAEHRKALAILEAVAASEPDSIECQDRIATVHSALADTLAAQKRYGDAATEARASVTIRDRLAQSGDAGARTVAAVARCHLASILRVDRASRDEAASLFDQCMPVLRELATAGRLEPAEARVLAEAEAERAALRK